MITLPRLHPKQLSGTERFTYQGSSLPFDVLEFWRWSASDLMSNATRGLLAEFIVAKALGISTSDVRDEWAPFDLVTQEGTKIEVKSSGYLQSWAQTKLYVGNFNVPATRKWSSETGQMATQPTREADVYVFALHKHKDKATVNPTDVEQWEFYVLGTRSLEARKSSHYSVALLRKINAGPYSFDGLKAATLKIYKAPDETPH